MLDDYQVFLFDFDGLLVNTEKLHWEAYRRLCARYGYTLPWDFAAYCAVAHTTSNGLKEALSPHLPEPWADRYEEKRQFYVEILHEGNVELMPGVEPLLVDLARRGAPRAVVTHSPADHLAIIRAKHPLLNTIPNWITREDYDKPKPDPECYQLAIERLAEPHQQVIGFEDSLRGLTALRGTRATPVLVTTADYPPIEGVIRLETLVDLADAS
jgi:HAD superfamily hydrolase (TIGR01509 family)